MPAQPLFSSSEDLRPSPKILLQNFGLTRETFGEMREALADGDQRLLEKVFLSHFEVCMNYLVSRDKMTRQEAYDATMATMARFSDLLLEGRIRYGNLRYLFTRMARQNHLQTVRRQRIFTELTEEANCIPADEPDFPDEEFGVMSRAFSMLGPDCRELLRNYYYRNRSLKNIAKTQDRAATAVRKQKSRCVATLKRYFYSAR